ncbi:hydrolase [Shinella sp. 838]|uniref:serine hydrolase domain-containing protein n=2 Tax=Shinella TaxID=323620 RepID=UPI0003C55F47|nr:MULTISPECIES: hydrolase [unclassified Shinella]EYR80788.1 penicillin-binding protein, beta-lactamase class C [Shinella sp. DD12]MCA0341929.1 hydrolase [Pseudomonadota bacterium]MDG4671287.1 hydrolase [Shinella sp. 838]
MDDLNALLSSGGSTALLAIRGREVVFARGFHAHRSSVASVRKSLIGILYGIAVAAGEIDIHATLDALGIDDLSPLTAQEKQATVADLMKSRSGVYHPCVYGMEPGRPVRGSHAPGTFWYYNNWDFNALGTIYRQETGRTLAAAFREQVAEPLQMQDFAAEDVSDVFGPQSRHPVYKMRLSGRDLARIGRLVLEGGRWEGRQVVPEAWVAESTRPLTDLGGGRGYGYLWWSAEANAPGDDLATDWPIVYASGAGGQYIIVIAALDLVVVHRAADVDNGISHARMGQILRALLRTIV